jgi:hypothetical protein
VGFYYDKTPILHWIHTRGVWYYIPILVITLGVSMKLMNVFLPFMLGTTSIIHTMEEQLEKNIDRELSPSPINSPRRTKSIAIPKERKRHLNAVEEITEHDKALVAKAIRKEKGKRKSAEDITDNEKSMVQRDHAQQRISKATEALIKLRDMYDDMGLLEQKTIALREQYFAKSDEAQANIKAYIEYKKSHKGEIHQVDAQVLVLHKRLKELTLEVTKLEKDLSK